MHCHVQRFIHFCIQREEHILRWMMIPIRLCREFIATEKPTLDDCVEVNGYLEAIPGFNKPHKLVRQDTIPKYIAPVPASCNYGELYSSYSCQY